MNDKINAIFERLESIPEDTDNYTAWLEFCKRIGRHPSKVRSSPRAFYGGLRMGIEMLKQALVERLDDMAEETLSYDEASAYAIVADFIEDFELETDEDNWPWRGDGEREENEGN